MITLKLEPEQCEFLEAALEKAMDNECDAEYYGAYDELYQLVKQAQENFYEGHD